MSLSLDFAPCPPYFVDNIYEIFISTAANNNLTTDVTVEIWNKCNLLYPYPPPTTTPTTTTTTTPSTTTTEETTTTTKQTTTTTKQASTTTQTPEQTTIKTTTPKQTTTTTQEQTITPTTRTTQQTTTTTSKQSPTRTSENTVTSTTTTNSVKPETVSTVTTTTTISSSTQEVTDGPMTLTSSAKCDAGCLSLVLSLAGSIILGILIVVIYYRLLHRNRKHVFKHSHRNNGQVTDGNYIPKFPKMSKQAEFITSPISFSNPTFHGDPFDPYRAEYQPITDIFPWSQRHSEAFKDFYNSHYEVFVNSEPHFYSNENRKNGNSRSPKSNIRRVRHTSIGSHVPKMLPEYTEIFPFENAEIYPFGIEHYDKTSRNSGLPKMSIESPEVDEVMDSVPRKHKLPRIPLEDNLLEPSDTYARTKQSDIPEITMNEHTDERENDNGIVTHGLPRTPFKETEIRDNSTWMSGLPILHLDGSVRGHNKYHSKHGLPRTPLDQPVYGDKETAIPKQNRQPKDFKGGENEIFVNDNSIASPYSLYQGQKHGGINNRGKDVKESDDYSNIMVPYTRL